MTMPQERIERQRRLQTCMHEGHTPVQAPLKAGVWEGCPAPKAAPQSSLFLLSLPPTPIPTERQSILLLKRKTAEGHIAVDVWELG